MRSKKITQAHEHSCSVAIRSACTLAARLAHVGRDGDVPRPGRGDQQRCRYYYTYSDDCCGYHYYYDYCDDGDDDGYAYCGANASYYDNYDYDDYYYSYDDCDHDDYDY